MPDHYLQCASDTCHGTHFAVVRNESGEIQRYECAECGGTAFERGKPAPDRRPA